MSDITVGWIGIGNMGWPMARNAKKAGVDIAVFDLDQDKLGRFAEEFDAKRASSLAALSEMSDVIVTIVPDGKVVRRICFGDGDNLAAGFAEGKILVDMSSSAPVGTRELGEELKAKGITLIDAPVSGGVTGAENATLSIMVGCSDEDALAKVMPFFEATGKNIFRCGPLGAGHAMKCLNNYLSAVGLTAANEALLIGQKFGLDPSAMVDILNVSTGRNSSTERKYHQSVLPRTYVSGFSTALMAKDVGIANGLAGDQDMTAPLLNSLNDIWSKYNEIMPTAAHEATIEVLEKANKIKLNGPKA
ncbi:NAD(P)-dependent oxidoreductase [Thalassobaculum sp. OXR-137]|nr:NAD(P)-dependent oxidoreductase [Thalassobaculum sp. OXR-137]WPZ34771.1 NAD(P)-dependent oxidoreductase [Thalassobaculum sp. OXR-137]